jgi:phosphatidylinositol glycan class T
MAPPLPPTDVAAEEEEEAEFTVWPVVVNVNPSVEDGEPVEEMTLDQKAAYFAKALRKNGQYTFDTRTSTNLNVEMKWPMEGDFYYPARYESPSLLASRSFSGYGQEQGQMELTLRNKEATRERRVTYFEVLPWFIKPYLHTLSIQVEADDYDEDQDNLVRFQDDLTAPLLLSLDHSPSPFHIEAQLRVPPQSTLRLTLDYDKSFLRYAQHPPDAHRGFDVAPAAIIVEDGSKIYTNPALIEVAVPDFSMPYNVM